MARKKTETQVEKANLMDARWINTPFAFARFGKDFSLLQQHVMLIVSDHLQDYLTKFFKDRRNLNPDNPLSLFDDQTLAAGIPDLKINIAEFEMSSNNNYELYKAFNEISQVQLKVPVYEDGHLDRMDWLPVFSKMSIPLTPNTESDFVNFDYRRGYVELKINPLVASYAFNMRLGYVNHPLNIAKDSKMTYAPRLYFLIKHKMAKGRRSVTIPYEELRKELGMEIIDKETHEKTGEMYPVFSKFKSRVLDAAISDIERMSDLNLIDVKFSYEVNYRGTAERGCPESITFTVTLTPLGEFHKDPKKATAHMEISITTSTTPQPAPKKRGRPKKQTTEQQSEGGENLFNQQPEDLTDVLLKGDRADVWAKLVSEYNGPYKSQLEGAAYEGTRNGAFIITGRTIEEAETLVQAFTTEADLKSLLEKFNGEQFYMNRIKIGKPNR